MKKLITLCTLFLVPLWLHAGITTYTFTSLKWASRIDATPCNGTTDGWVSDKDAGDYCTGYTDGQGIFYYAGASVKTGSTGAGATSVLEFTDVRRITFRFCQNKSKGKGVIYVQVGDNTPDSIVVYKPASGTDGQYFKDSTISYATPQSGKIRFWVKCTENAINIYTISIRSASGGSNSFTTDSYQLVTDVALLEDSDQVIIGVHKEGVNYIMGYFDEYESQNNIHAIAGRYSADRNTVNPDDRAIYTLRITELNGTTAYIFQDELRYEKAYLVASGGRTKNRLAIWDKLTDENTYGNYGYWSIEIDGGEAIITNRGNSLSKIIQYNADNNPTLFSCYQERSQTPVALYRRVEALGDIEAIVAPFVNFGTTTVTEGQRTIEVNANRLSADIQASMADGSIFSLSASILDRDGDQLTISYSAPVAGHYTDTLILRSGTTETRAVVTLNRLDKLDIAEAVVQPDYATVYLNDVVVTKKYDTYIYIRDATGSMLIFDRGDGTGHRYGADLKAGDPLSGVVGRMQNYYGVPELSPTAHFSVGSNNGVNPEPAPELIDSADVCRYLLLEQATISGSTLTYRGHEYAMQNKFNLSSLIEGEAVRTTCIVSYDRDVVTLYIVAQERITPDGLNENAVERTSRVILRDGIMLIQTADGLYTLTGERMVSEE